MIVAVLNQKGGSGKTTLAVHIAGAWARRGASVLLIDSDAQSSALAWAERRAREGRKRLFGVIGLARETLHREVPELARAVDHIVIDGPPRITPIMRSAMLASDVTLIPIQPSAYDVWASQAVLDLAHEAAIYKPRLRTFFVVTRRIVRTVIARDVLNAIAELHIPALDASLGQRVVFAETAGRGLLAREIDPRSPAAHEVEALAAELLKSSR